MACSGSKLRSPALLLTVFLLTHGDEFLINGGWRIPFILSFVLVIIGLWVRKSLPETPDYSEAHVEKSTETHLNRS
jgi:MFS family permease